MIFNILVLYFFTIFLISQKRNLSDKVFYFNCLVIILVVGLRGYDIGSVDTLNYVKFFLNIQDYYNESDREIEIGLPIFNKILQPLLYTGWQYLLFCACFSFFPLFLFIKKYSKNLHLSLLVLFILLGNIISIYFVCTRQALGMALVFWGIIVFKSNYKYRLLVFILFSIAGYLMHTVGLMISFIFICLYYIKIPRWLYAVICIITFFIGSFKIFGDMSIIGFVFMYTGSFFERLSNYTDGVFDMEANNLLYPFIRTILGCMLCLFVNKPHYHDISTKMFLIGIIIGNIFPTFIEGYRLVGIFTIFGTICISYLYYSLFVEYNYRSNIYDRLRLASKYIFMFLLLYSGYKYISSNIDLIDGTRESKTTMIPYDFFWEDKYSF